MLDDSAYRESNYQSENYKTKAPRPAQDNPYQAAPLKISKDPVTPFDKEIKKGLKNIDNDFEFEEEKGAPP